MADGQTTSRQLEFASVALGYGKRVVATDFSWRLERPAVVALVGPNGAGKSTLMKALAGLLTPTTGNVHVLGKSYEDRKHGSDLRRQVGYLAQGSDLPPSFTIDDYVSYAAWLKAVPKSEIPMRTAQALDAVDLADRSRARIKTLSGGMRRRVQIAATLVGSPNVLLLDEPTAGLDPAQRAHFHRVIHALPDQTTVMVSTHLLEDVVEVCSHVVAVTDGSVVFDGGVAELAQLGEGSLMRGYNAAMTNGL